MESFESIPKKIEIPEESEPKKDGYQIAVEAVDDLTNILKQKVWSKEQAKEKASIICKNLPHLYAKEDNFFEIMPIALKLSELGSSTEVLEIDMLSNDGYAMLSNGIQKMLRENKELPVLNQEKIDNLFQSLLEVFWKGNFFTVPAIHDFLEKYKAEIEHTINGSGFEESKENYTQLTSFLESNFARTHLAHLAQEELYKNRYFLEWSKYGREIIVGLLEKYGLDKEDSEDILNSWLSRREEKDKKNEPPISDNFHVMNLLEAEPKDKEIVKFLYEKLGIRNFDRYPAELLLAQLKDFKNKKKPYGIIINPTNDWNGAFSHNISSWHGLYDQLKEQGYTLRVMECGSKIEIARRLINLDRKYGKSHKISFAFIGGHGTEKTIQFGGDKPINTLHIDDLAGKGVKRSSKFFEDNPTIVLISCSTGADKGIGEKLSETLGAKVIAPDKPSNIWNINVAGSKDGLDFDIEYTEKKSKKVFTKGRIEQ